MDTETLRHAFEGTKNFEPYEFIYSTHSYILCALNSILFIISLFYVKYSKLNSNYEFKPIALHSIFTCWLMVLILTLTQPIGIPPLFGSYAIGILKLLGPEWPHIEFGILWCCIANLGIVFGLGTLIQNSRMQLVNSNFVIKILLWFECESKIWRFLNFSFIFHAILIFVPFLIARLTTEDLKEIDEVRTFLTTHPSTIILQPKMVYPIKALFYLLILVLLLEFLFSLSANIYTLMSIRQMSKIVNPRTLKMQMTMFKLCFFQFLMIIVFFYLPTVFVVLGFFKVIQQVFTSPIIVSIMLWYYPFNFLVNLLRFSSVRRIFSETSNFSRS